MAWIVDAAVAGLVFTPLNPLLYSSEPSATLGLSLGAPAIALLYVYLVAFDGGTKGATPGKRLLRLRVVDEHTGTTIGLRRAAVRRLWYLVGGLAFFAGWLWAFLDPERQAWHDKFAHSLVVRSR